MSYFTIAPDPNFSIEMPMGLYHSAYAYGKMLTTPQRRQTIGRITDLDRFSTNRQPENYQALEQRFFESFGRKRDWSGGFDFEKMREPKIELHALEAHLSIKTTQPVESGNVVRVPDEYTHHADILALILNYEHGLCPELFSAKTFVIEERTIPDIREFARKNNQYVGSHYDQKASSIVERKRYFALRHIFIVSDDFGTIFDDVDGISQSRSKDVDFYNGMMKHRISMPDPEEPKRPRTALIVYSDMFNLSATQHEILVRNTAEQLRRMPMTSPVYSATQPPSML